MRTLHRLTLVLLMLALATVGARASTGSFDLSPTLDLASDFLSRFLGDIAMWVIPLALAAFGDKFPLLAPFVRMAVAHSQFSDNAKVTAMIKQGLDVVVADALKSGTTVDLRNGHAADAARWVQDQIPGTLDRLGVSPEQLAGRVEAVAASHLTPVPSDAVPAPRALASNAPRGL